MKRTASFLKALLAVSLLFQGEALVATCVASLPMTDAAKMACAMGAGPRQCRAMAPEQGGTCLSRGACCRLELRAQLPAVGVAKVKPARALFEGFAVFLPLHDHGSQAVLESLHECRAGPPDYGPSPALLAVPPQNAPPVLV